MSRVSRPVHTHTGHRPTSFRKLINYKRPGEACTCTLVRLYDPSQPLPPDYPLLVGALVAAPHRYLAPHCARPLPTTPTQNGATLKYFYGQRTTDKSNGADWTNQAKWRTRLGQKDRIARRATRHAVPQLRIGRDCGQCTRRKPKACHQNRRASR